MAAAACALHLLLILRLGGLYARRRHQVQLLQRALRLAPRLMVLIWPAEMKGFLSTFVPWHHGSSWVLATILLAPGLSMAMSSFNFSLPFQQHLLMALPQLALDAVVLAPLLGCEIHRFRLEAAAGPLCRLMNEAARVLFGLAPWPAAMGGEAMEQHNLYWALPLFTLVGIGTTLPLLGTYLLETLQKVGHLRGCGLLHPRLQLWPSDLSTRVYLSMQLYTALAATFGFAVGWPAAMGWTVQGQCALVP
jgi:hypothetical protein